MLLAGCLEEHYLPYLLLVTPYRSINSEFVCFFLFQGTLFVLPARSIASLASRSPSSLSLAASEPQLYYRVKLTRKIVCTVVTITDPHTPDHQHQTHTDTHRHTHTHTHTRT